MGREIKETAVNFNRSAALAGAEGVREAAERKGGSGDFKPFAPEIQWRNDGDEKYVIILTPMADVLGFRTHEWVEVGTGEKANGETYKKYEWFFDRRDPAIGEDYDDLSQRLDNDSKVKQFGVAVELEPVLEAGRGGRQKVVGFEVKTSTYNKKGEDDEVLEITQPVVGVVMQAAQNFWGSLATHDEAQSAIEETPFQIIRRGKGTDTTYDFIHFMDVPVDYTNLIEYIDGVTYLSQDPEFPGVLAEAAAADDDASAAELLGAALLDVRLNELADKERYDRLVKPITHLEQRFPKKGKKGAAKAEKAAPKERPTRATRRPRAEAVETAAEAAPAEVEVPVAETKAKPKAAKPKAETPAEPAADKPDRFAKLRARAEQTPVAA